MDAIYISRDDPHDIGSWSGTTYCMARALEAAGFRLSYVGPLRHRLPLWYKIKGRLVRMRGWDYNSLGEPAVLKSYARQAERRLRGLPGRILLSCGKPHLVHLQTDLPIIFYDDASVPALLSLYPHHTNPHPRIRQNLFAAEQRVLEKCLYACYFSDWAVEAALAAYGQRFASKIKVIPIGANIENLPDESELPRLLQARRRADCQLLFVGVDWHRKGGAIAVAVASELQARGIPVRLDLVGCVPPVVVPEFVRVHGFVSQRTPEGKARLDRLYRESHFFLLPTQAEAYGVVFVEACAYGLPSLGCRVGGVSTIIRDGVNGWLFPPEAPAKQYADRIEQLWRARDLYESVCAAAFREAQTRLSWKRFGQTVYSLARNANLI